MKQIIETLIERGWSVFSLGLDAAVEGNQIVVGDEEGWYSLADIINDNEAIGLLFGERPQLWCFFANRPHKHEKCHISAEKNYVYPQWHQQNLIIMETEEDQIAYILENMEENET